VHHSRGTGAEDYSPRAQGRPQLEADQHCVHRLSVLRPSDCSGGAQGRSGWLYGANDHVARGGRWVRMWGGRGCGAGVRMRVRVQGGCGAGAGAGRGQA